jgi:signal transduction histidine kinase
MQFVLDRPMPGHEVRIEWNGREIFGVIRYRQADGPHYRLGVELTSSWDSLVGEVLAQQARELEAANQALDRALAAAREASAVKSRFLARASHEQRTPLNGIVGFAQLLHDGQIGPVTDGQRECLADILACSENLLKLIGTILDLNRIESGKMELYYEPVELASLVEDVAGTLAAVAAARHIAVECDCSAGPETAWADPARLREVLYNYLSNALKFTPEGGRVSIRILPVGISRFRVEVKDTGPGISARDIPRLFSEFSQLKPVEQSQAGSGLGLAIVKHIVEAQGGSVGVESTPGQGSCFYAELPARSGPVTAALQPPLAI